MKLEQPFERGKVEMKVILVNNTAWCQYKFRFFLNFDQEVGGKLVVVDTL